MSFVRHLGALLFVVCALPVFSAYFPVEGRSPSALSIHIDHRQLTRMNCATFNPFV
jgi:hypothetical protein